MEISLKFVSRVPINNIPALVQIMAWRRLGDKPLSDPMMDSLPTHICVTRPQWVNAMNCNYSSICKVLFHNDLSLSGEQPEWCLFTHMLTANLRFNSNLSSVLMLHKTRRYQIKLDSTKSLRVCYWYFKIPQYRNMELGLKDTEFYVWRCIAPRPIRYNPL